MQDVKDSVSEYYGETIDKTDDLEASACCVTDYDAALLEDLTDEVLDRRYGCGSPIPALLEGQTVVDLGSGAGADCFIASQLVGPEGRVIGVDMTDEQLEIARANIEPHMERFGFEEPNVEFVEGDIEDLPLEDGVADVVISNCVINLCEDKRAVFEEIDRVLKAGGEFYISDIVADRRVPEHLQENDKLWSECLTGAAYSEDLRRIMAEAGFPDVRTVESSPTGDVVEGIRFRSEILRGFDVELEDRCEDYGQTAVYRGTIPDHEGGFALDQNHDFEPGEAMRVCRNTARMLTETRFAEHFHVSEPLTHLGLFDCNEPADVDESADVEAEDEMPESIEVDDGGSCC